MNNDITPNGSRPFGSRFRHAKSPHKERSIADLEHLQVQPESTLDDLTGQDEPSNIPPENNESPNLNQKPKNFFKKLTGAISLKRWRLLSKKQRLASLAVMGVLMIGGTVGALALFTSDPPPPAPVVITPKVEPPKPKTVPSRLTGVLVKPELNELPTTAVLIENSPDARPQSGLHGAGVVFEAIAEGGITRFMALYQESRPPDIGPVRSVRPYFLDFLVPFDAPIAHAGGSGQALAQIQNESIKDLDQSFNPNSYRRVSNRFAPHNLYTTGQQLLDLQKSKGFDKSKFSGFVRGGKDKPAKKPNATKIDLAISAFLYDPSFSYDAKTNSYLRNMAGKPHIDAVEGKQINPKVVIVLVSGYSKDGIYSVYQTSGSGIAYIFQNGVGVEGIWEKSGRAGQYKFGDSKGAPIALNPGQTWVTLVDSPTKVIITP